MEGGAKSPPGGENDGIKGREVHLRKVELSGAVRGIAKGDT